MTRKNLYDWWCNGIDSDEKNRLEQIGINANSSSSDTYTLNDLKKVLRDENALKRLSHPITGQIHFILFFSTWFCNDCVVAINGDSNYRVWLWVYEPSFRNFGEWSAYNSTSTESSFYTAKDRARTLKDNLWANNPAIYRNLPVKITYYGESSSPEMSLVGRSELSTSLSNPDQYIRPLDIVKVYGTMKREGREIAMLHSGIYLGSGKVAHAIPRSGYLSSYLDSYSGNYGNYNYNYNYYGYYSYGYDYNYANYYPGYYLPIAGYYGSIGSSYSGSSERDAVEIVNWERFRKFWMREPDKIVRVKITIPFKYREDIIRHIAKAYTADSTYFDRKGKFSLADNNCEVFVNRCVLGLDFSEHGEIKKEKDARKDGRTYYKKERIENYELRGKIEETGNFLDNLTSSTSKVSDIKGYMSATPERIGQSFDATIEVEPKYGYKFKN